MFSRENVGSLSPGKSTETRSTDQFRPNRWLTSTAFYCRRYMHGVQLFDVSKGLHAWCTGDGQKFTIDSCPRLTSILILGMDFMLTPVSNCIESVVMVQLINSNVFLVHYRQMGNTRVSATLKMLP